MRLIMHQLRWQACHLVEVSESITLGYSQDQVTPSFKARVCFRAILLCLLLERVLKVINISLWCSIGSLYTLYTFVIFYTV